MNESSLNIIKNKIYFVRGKEVMLDFDLAEIYKCANGTKSINLAVKRNIEKFPEKFMFQLTKEEYYEILRFQNETLELEQGKYSKYLPYAFTEQGVAMLSSVLRTPAAVETSIQIMDAFVSMRHYLNENRDLYQSINRLTNKVDEHEEKLELLFSNFDRKEKLFLPNAEYDSYSYVFNILKKAKKELVIIDPYADITMLDLIRNIECSIILITSNKSKLLKSEIDKFNKQYNKLKVIKSNNFHDRYFILDRKEIYHIGTSINHMGNKVFSINLLEDDLIKNNLIKYIDT